MLETRFSNSRFERRVEKNRFRKSIEAVQGRRVADIVTKYRSCGQMYK